MRNEKFRRAAALFLSTAVSATLLAGCGTGGQNGSVPGTEQGTGRETVQTGQAAESGAVTVRTAEELLEAVRPGAEIVVEPGSINLSEYTRAVWDEEGEAWNERHPYVRLQDCYDGIEAVIQNVDGLSIAGQSADTIQEILIDPRYGTVLTFENCSGVTLSNLTLGHTDGGICSGNVVNLRGAADVELANMELFGCGAVGLECSDGTGGVRVRDSVIRDCSYSPLYIYNCAGPLAFYDCLFAGSQDGGYYDGGSESELSFYRCIFGAEETLAWLAQEGVYTEDCIWSEPGDYEEEDELSFRPETMTELEITAEGIGDTWWVGYTAVDAETGETAAPPSGGDLPDVGLTLHGDGTGSLSGWFSDTVPLFWTADGGPSLTFTARDGSEYTAVVYSAEEGSYPNVWLAVTAEDAILWMY